MSILFKRSFHNKRISNYDGYWNLILYNARQVNDTIPYTSSIEKKPITVPIEKQKVPITVPSIDIIEEPKPPVKPIVYLKGEPIELPEKPLPPENCCMSGCVNCVWDLYQEDMEEYNSAKNEIKQRFIEANEPLPSILSKHDPAAEMDPTMKAFLELEKKLK